MPEKARCILLYRLSPMVSPVSAYLHIPFCRRRCYYCDFPVAVVGDKPPLGGDRINGSNSKTIAHYVDILCQEIDQTEPVGEPLETIFFGGGTPSLLASDQVERILAKLKQRFGLASSVEISMEVDPGTFDLNQIQGFQTAGVNRVSVGVQAFQPELLKVCGRSHTVAEIYQAIDQVRQVDFRNISLDLISGLPHQTLENWQESLEAAIALQPDHLSCYDLIIESGTAFSRQYKPGDRPLPADDVAATMYRTAQRVLTGAGYEHYEISNYARPGYQCRHNRVYWESRPFYGFGMGATSYVNGDRWARPRQLLKYYAWVQAQPTAKIKSKEAGNSDADRVDRLLETLMVGLRLQEGVDLANLAEQFGAIAVQRIWQRLQPYQQQGWVEIRPLTGKGEVPMLGRLRLTDPEGFLFSNVVLTALFEEFEADSL